MVNVLRRAIEKIENTPTSFPLWLSSFLVIITLRVLIENWFEGFKNRSGLFLFYEFAHTFLFFLIAYIFFIWILKKLLKIELKKISNILLWGYLIIIFPPIIDYLISRGQGYWSFYDFGGIKDLFVWFFTFFDKTPEIGITYGVRIEIVITLIFMFIYSLLKIIKKQETITNKISNSNIQNAKYRLSDTKIYDVLGSSIVTLLAYIIIFILGTFPSWVTIATRGFVRGFLNITDIDTVQMFLAPVTIFSKNIPDITSSLNIKMSLVYVFFAFIIIIIGLYYNYQKKLVSFIKNARFPQLIYHTGLFIVGMGAGIIFTEGFAEFNFFNSVAFLVSLSAIVLSWLASVVVNDLEDKEIDKVTPNKNRPLIIGDFSEHEYKTIGIVLFLASLFFSAIVNFKIALFLFAYQALAWIYSVRPLRLKRFAFISTFVSALASLLIFFSGYILISPDQSLSGLPFPIILLLVFGYTFSLSIKDFKDIKGDQKEGVYTIPVLFGEEWGKIIVGSGIFLSFILSVLIFNEFRLFWWALIFGTISFWLVISSKKTCPVPNYKFWCGVKPAKLPWWILGTISLYGSVLVKIIFL
jgi:4-hydroxybenzoate polyprenyltransferase